MIRLSNANNYSKTKDTLDSTGGTWKTFIVNPEIINQVLLPLDNDDAQYNIELAEIRQKQISLSEENFNEINYWNTGAVLRWQKFARNLVAKYNNFSSWKKNKENPKLIYANPLYASRAYALLSVAQYDALICAWKCKALYRSKAPLYRAKGIKEFIPINPELFSYPSEHAVVARVSSELLKYLFPQDSVLIKRTALLHCNSRIAAGANTRSEIEAGEKLGELIADMIIAYAQSDGADLAKGKDTIFTDKSSWNSLHIPPRPPLLPLWGNVRTWNVVSAQQFMLGLPPAIGSLEFKAALNEVYQLSKFRSQQHLSCAFYWADGANTFTPPGHWNVVADSLIKAYNFNELRASRTFALLNTALMDAGICCWYNKYKYVYPRPTQADLRIVPATDLPNFPSYPSGHAAFSGAAATVLSYIFPKEKKRLDAMAQEAAMSRLYGSIHYRFDNDSGLVCGKRIGTHAVARGRKDGSQ